MVVPNSLLENGIEEGATVVNTTGKHFLVFSIILTIVTDL